MVREMVKVFISRVKGMYMKDTIKTIRDTGMVV